MDLSQRCCQPLPVWPHRIACVESLDFISCIPNHHMLSNREREEVDDSTLCMRDPWGGQLMEGDRGDGTGACQLAAGNGGPTECRRVTFDQWRFTRAFIPHPPCNNTTPLSSAPAARSLMRDGWVLCEGECVSQLRTPTRVRIRPFSHRVTDGSWNSQIA